MKTTNKNRTKSFTCDYSIDISEQINCWADENDIQIKDVRLSTSYVAKENCVTVYAIVIF